MALETSHRGYAIRYSENEDKWRSYEAGDGMEAETLSKLKDKIDRMIAKQKKETSINFFVLEGDHSRLVNSLTEAKMTAYVGPEMKNKSYSSTEKVVVGHKVEAIYVASNWGKRGEKAARRSIGLNDCCLDTAEVHAAVAEANRLGTIAKQAAAAHHNAVKAIPRMTLADIESLVKLSGIDPTGAIAEGRA